MATISIQLMVLNQIHPQRQVWTIYLNELVATTKKMVAAEVDAQISVLPRNFRSRPSTKEDKAWKHQVSPQLSRLNKMKRTGMRKEEK